MNNRLFVGGLPWAVDDNSLREHFEKAGTVVDAKVITDRMSGRSRGFGFVEMGSPEEAQAAIDMWHDKELDGRKLIVNVAREREER